jgi:hypothetical protein
VANEDCFQVKTLQTAAATEKGSSKHFMGVCEDLLQEAPAGIVATVSGGLEQKFLQSLHEPHTCSIAA